MRDRKKTLVCMALFLTACLSLLSGCTGGGRAADNSPGLPVGVMKAIEASETVTLVGDTSAGNLYWPKNKAATLSKVAGWLRRARPYQGAVPRSAAEGLTFAANINPSTVVLVDPENREIDIYPEYYFARDGSAVLTRHFVTNVLKVRTQGKEYEIYSPALCDWLRNNR